MQAHPLVWRLVPKLDTVMDYYHILFDPDSDPAASLFLSSAFVGRCEVASKFIVPDCAGERDHNECASIHVGATDFFLDALASLASTIALSMIITFQ